MKIAYVAIMMNRKLALGGVGRKMNMQVDIWRGMGHDARIFVLSTEELPFPDWHVFKKALFKGHRLVNILQREIRTSFSLAELVKEVKSYQPDILFFRYYRYYPGLERLFRIAPTVIELNSNDLVEMKSSSRLDGMHNRLTRPIIFRAAAAFNPVSHEIGEIRQNTRYHLPTLVLGNGIDLQKFPPLPAPSNPFPRFVLVSSDFVPWHGDDKIVNFFRNNPDLHLDMVGYNADAFPQKLPPNVQTHGLLGPVEVAEFMSRADVAFGTVALHRIKMNEASPLKVREALAHGVPLVIAYEDTDLMGLELDTILRLPNIEDNLETHAQEIRDFAYRMRGQRVARDLVADRIDYRQKEKRRLAFFQDVLEKKGKLPL